MAVKKTGEQIKMTDDMEVTIVPGKPKQGKRERRVRFDTLEKWLKVTVDTSEDVHIRMGRLQMAIAWVLGKDSDVANEIFTRFNIE